MRFEGMRSLSRLGLFAGLIGLELWLAGSMSAQPSIRGYIEIRQYGVSSTRRGILRKIDVALGQAVTAGQVIAEVDVSVEAERAERKLVPGSAGDDTVWLTSPADGRVESIEARPGDAIAPSSTVVTVVGGDTRRVITCVPESRIAEVEIGDSAEVRPSLGGEAVRGAVESLTPAVAILPERCQPLLGKQAVYGRVAVVVLDEPVPAMPGQTQLIAFGPGHRASTTGVPSTLTAAAPRLIDIPPRIADASAFEASGLVWVPRLDRYVVISDDTGRGDIHPPWLFTMTRRGVVDPDPVAVEGIDQFDDLESIAPGDNDALWLLSSQSVSRAGKRPRHREVLARVVPSERGYKLDAKIHLASLLEAAPEPVRRELGVVDTHLLDIEGMACRHGALYLGLKAPADAQGRAIIWRISAPERLLHGDLAGAAVTMWGAVQLDVEIEGRRVDGGIADMMFVSDTRLLVAATTSGTDAKHQTSALYAVVQRDGALHATRLRTFPGLKAEGITAAPDPHRLAIVFDRGSRPAMWLELDMPELQ